MARFKYLLVIFLFINNNANAQPVGSSLNVMYTGIPNTYLLSYICVYDCGMLPSPFSYTACYTDGSSIDTIAMLQTGFSVFTPSYCYINGCGIGMLVQIIYQAEVVLQQSALYRFYTYDDVTKEFYTEAEYIADTLLNNTQPSFYGVGEYYFCLNNAVMLNSSATDVDADSLSYSLIAAREFDSLANSGLPVSYSPPLSPVNFTYSSTPIFLDSITGMISFTPDSPAFDKLVVKINEFRSGAWIGSTMRETRFKVSGAVIDVGGGEEIESSFIYPNPSSDKIKIAVNDIKSYTISDAAGRLLQNGIPYGQTIDISMLPQGVYILSLKSEKGISSCRLIKTE